MRSLLILSLSLLGFLDVSGQLVTLPEGRGFSRQSKFSQSFISANDIKEIEITDELKPDGEKIKPTGRKTVYRFAASGRVKSIREITKSRDTLLTVFEYLDGRLSCETRNDAAGLFSYCYTYEGDGMPVSVKYSRLGKRKKEKQATEIYTEKFEHKNFGTQLHSTQFNTSGRPYRKEIRYYDENGYLTKFLSDFVMTTKREEEKYDYNERGLLSGKEISTPNDSYQVQFEYDQAGNLLSEERCKDGTKVERLEYVYREEDMLLQAELTRDEVKQAILIRSYSYSFK